jgi:hypothetical protein
MLAGDDEQARRLAVLVVDDSSAAPDQPGDAGPEAVAPLASGRDRLAPVAIGRASAEGHSAAPDRPPDLRVSRCGLAGR